VSGCGCIEDHFKRRVWLHSFVPHSDASNDEHDETEEEFEAVGNDEAEYVDGVDIDVLNDRYDPRNVVPANRSAGSQHSRKTVYVRTESCKSETVKLKASSSIRTSSVRLRARAISSWRCGVRL
jgi:hypothetical protein